MGKDGHWMKKTDVMGVAFDDMTMDEAADRALALAKDGAGDRKSVV